MTDFGRMKRKSPKSIPTPPARRGPTLVWDGVAPRPIETVTVWRKVIRDTRRGGHVTLEVPISLPRIRFLEVADDSPLPIDTAAAVTLAEGDAMPLAA